MEHSKPTNSLSTTYPSSTFLFANLYFRVCEIDRVENFNQNCREPEIETRNSINRVSLLFPFRFPIFEDAERRTFVTAEK